MISKTSISRTLTSLDTRYKRSTSAREGLIVSKMAVLELCGWLEESMDDIAFTTIKKNVRDAKLRKYANKKIKRVYGFEYDDHFRSVLMTVYGVTGLWQIERAVGPISVEHLRSKLSILIGVRHKLAHTYLREKPITIPAPSVTKSDFALLYPLLEAYQQEIKNLKVGRRNP